MLAKRLKELRKLKGMTQAQLARELGISPSAVGMYEQGRREPDHEMLGKICGLFHVSSDFFLKEQLPTEQQDLDQIIDGIRETILSPEGLMFNGVPVDPADCEKIVDAIRLGVNFVFDQKRRSEGQ